MDMKPAGPAAIDRETRRTVMVSSMASDSHTWNLIYLQLLLEEMGHRVVNLGACVPDEVIIEQCASYRPDVVVLSSVNGHGYQDGLRLVRRLRADPTFASIYVVIGGKLGIGGADPQRAPVLLAAGFDAVFEDDRKAAALLREFIDSLPATEVELVMS
ncbi:cobalamin B12-binding domain-containing protein [Streptomyces sp. NPDC021218]|uniref:cobalamin B12-binding domain-containing protein n=1 Tax=Streptomyces sp. NPDC021218 TaxID=3365119 RepID=UPI00379BEB2A